MFSTNPFSILSETVPLIGIQSFVVIMVALVILGTVLDMIHKKNVKYFFNNAKKAKKNAKRELGSGERIAVIAKTIIHDIGTTSELGIYEMLGEGLKRVENPSDILLTEAGDPTSGSSKTGAAFTDILTILPDGGYMFAFNLIYNNFSTICRCGTSCSARK